jgi:hypothetical protein
MKTKLAILLGLIAVVFGVNWTIRHSAKPPGPVAAPANGSPVEAPSEPVKADKPRFVGGIDRIVDSGLHWEQRVQAVRELPDNLGAASVGRLFEFLKQPPAAGQEHWYLVCNEVMEVLRKRNLASGVYTRKHMELVQSTASDPMIRDYAAQHLAQWISGMDPSAREQDAAVAGEAFEVLTAEATKPANGSLTLVGTVLNSLTDSVIHGGQTMQAKRDDVARLAMSLVTAPSGALSAVNRTSALQAAAQLKAPGLPAACRRLAADDTESVDVRLSSIAALGLAGQPEDLPFVETYLSDPRFRFAASAAVARLKSTSLPR